MQVDIKQLYKKILPYKLAIIFTLIVSGSVYSSWMGAGFNVIKLLFYIQVITSTMLGGNTFSAYKDFIGGGLHFSCIQNNVTLEGIVSLSFIGILISSFILTIIYMFAIMISSDLLKGIVKKEGQNLVVSLILIILFIPLFLVINGFVDEQKYNFFGTEQKTIHKEAFDFAQYNFKKLSTGFIGVQYVTAWISVYSGSPISIRPMGLLGFDVDLRQGTNHIVTFLQNLNKLVFAGMGLWSVVMFILCFMRIEFLSILFPFGVFFRSFTVTKGFGSILIAISLSFYIFFPVLVFMDEIFYHMMFKETVTNSTNLKDYSPIEWDFTHILTGLKEILKILFTGNGIIKIAFYMTHEILILFQNFIFTVLFLGFFVQILNIYVLFIITGATAKILDTRVDLSSIEKLL